MGRYLLPPNRTPLESAVADACHADISAEPLRGLADADRCPVALLPWLAWSRSVDSFDAAAGEERQRALIRQSIDIHRRKGTVAAVRDVFRALGLGEVAIDQGTNGYCYDGAATYDGFASYDNPAGWAEYRVAVDKLLSVQQAEAARAVLADVAPVRCVLWGIDFSAANLIYNDEAVFDGSYTYGVA
jgi:phage tail P2-like protein